MLLSNETNRTDFIHLYCHDISAPMEFCRAVYDRNKQLEPFTYFTPAQFKEYLSSETASKKPIKVVGNVHLYQKEYKDSVNVDSIGEFQKWKAEEGIYGCFRIPYSDEYLEEHKSVLFGSKCKKFDLYESRDVRCMGYAQVGTGRFVRLVAASKLSTAVYGFLWLAALGLIFKLGLFINDLSAVDLV